MQYTCCERMHNGLTLHFAGFKYCCEVWEGPDYIPLGKNSFEINEERRLTLIEEYKKGIIPEKCRLCPLLETKEWNFDGKIKYLTIYNWDHCNAACVYCSNQWSGSFSEKKPQKSKYYDVYPIIRDLCKSNRINNNTEAKFIGGEPTMLKEFPKIMDLLIKNNCQIEILSNAVIYEKRISKALKARADNLLCVSIDCGTRESFYKIKRIDKFNEVSKNIKRYIKESKSQNPNVMIKYIVLPHFNDNKNEVDAWLELCKEWGTQKIALSLNYLTSMSNTTNNPVETSVLETYNYIKEKSEKMGFNLGLMHFAEIIIKNKKYNCREEEKEHS